MGGPACYHLNVCVSSKSTLNPNPQGDDIKVGPLGGD